MPSLLKTALYDQHKALNSKNVGFCGWDMPIQYNSIIQEHGYCRNDVALFDTSHMGELFFKGDIKTSGINEAVTIDIISLPIGKCKYGFLLNQKGGVIDDLIVYRLQEDEIMIVVNASRCKIDFTILQERIRSGNLTDESHHFSKLDVQGPNSKQILQNYFDINLDDLTFFSFVQTTLFNSPCILSRTGYTGELGFELYVNATTANRIWEALIQHNVKPAGLGSRDALRLEMGYSLYGNDLTEEITPLEAGLKHFINFDTSFIGKEALLQQKQEGLKRKIIPFTTNSRRSARKDFEVYQNNKPIGQVTSAAFSPQLGTGIGLALVNLDDFKDNEPFELKDKRGSIQAYQTTLPFYTK